MSKNHNKLLLASVIDVKDPVANAVAMIIGQSWPQWPNNGDPNVEWTIHAIGAERGEFISSM
jgi:hypothetical protein